MSIRDSLGYFIRFRGYEWLYGMRKNITVSHDQRFLALYREVTRSRRLTMNLPELYNIYRLVPQVMQIPGDLAEVGVFRGASARVICDVKGAKKLHLFDTFEGLPEINDNKDSTQEKTALSAGGVRSLTLAEGKFSASFQDVQNYLSPFNNVYFYRGIFPATAAPLQNERFSFVHLDADIYQSTLDGLRFFYPKLSKGGLLISHDYGTVCCPGVKKAFDEFMSDKNDPLIELWDTQVLLIKS